jgi:hypothetical protein
MTSQPNQGTYQAFPKHRRIVLDLCRAAESVPKFSVQRDLSLEPIFQARRTAPQRIGWAALFAKAYAIVSQEVPALRQVYVSRPRPRIYQHPFSVVSITVNRFDERLGCDRLMWANIRDVESLPLTNLQNDMDDYQHGDIKQLFRNGQRLDAMPQFLRNIVWHLLMNWMPFKKSKVVGTFSISSLATYGTTNPTHPLVTTTSISYGPLDDDYRSSVTLQADHRVIDGAILARALVRLEEVMNTAIISELKKLQSTATAMRQVG